MPWTCATCNASATAPPPSAGTCGTCATTNCGDCLRTMVSPAAKTLCAGCMDKELATLADKSMVVVGCPVEASSTYQPTDDTALAHFDVVTMTYAEGQALQKKKDPSLKGMQLEHGVPNSSFMMNPGRKGATVSGAGSYSEGSALIFPIGDDQSAGTEHKFLTNRERAFCKLCEQKGQYPTVDQWLRIMRPSWEDLFTDYRKYKGPAGQEREMARRASRALENRFRNQFNKLHVDFKARTKNGLAGGKAKAPGKKLKSKQEFNAL